MPLTIDQMRRASEAGDLPADVAAQVLVDFAEYVRGEGGITLDQAFGLNGPSGCDPWFVKLARERCRTALRTAADLLCPCGTISDRADALRARIQRYRATWLRRDQHRSATTSTDPIDRQMFAAFRAADGAIPDSFERLRKLLAPVSL